MSKRFQMELSDESWARIQKLKEEVEATSYSEIMKDALRVYEYLVKEQSAGHTFLIDDGKDRPTKLQIFT